MWGKMRLCKWEITRKIERLWQPVTGAMSASSTSKRDQCILPPNTKVSSQILIKQHLDAHYRKLQDVKATVDTTTPYSFCANPTTHGYKKTMRTKFRRIQHPKEPEDFATNFTEINKFSEDPAVDQIVKSFLAHKPLSSSDSISDDENVARTKERYSSAFESRGSSIRKNRQGSLTSYRTSATRPGSCGGDILQMHRDKFTEERPFCPRTVKSNVASKIRGLRCYNPPIKVPRSFLSGSQSGKLSGRSASATEPPTNQTPTKSSSRKHQRRRSKSTSKQTLELKRSGGSTEGSFTPPARVNGATAIGENVAYRRPPSNTRQDCFEQTANLGKVHDWLKNIPDGKHIYSPRQDTGEKIESVEPTIAARSQPPAALVTSAKQERTTEQKPENPVYWNFIEAVTNDVLERGVFTDRNLNSVLLEHTIRNEFGLSVNQLRQAAQHLRSQLHVTDDTEQICPPHPSVQQPLKASVKSACGDQRIGNNGNFSAGSPAIDLPSQSLNSTGARSVVLSGLPPPAPSRENKTGPFVIPIKSGSSGTHRPPQFHLKTRESNGERPSTSTNDLSQTAETDSEQNAGRSAQEQHSQPPRIIITPDTADSVELVKTNRTDLVSYSRSTCWSDATDSRAQRDDAEEIARRELEPDQEDTLTDQTTIPNLSVSLQCTEPSDIPEASPPDSQSESIKFEYPQAPSPSLGKNTPESPELPQVEDNQKLPILNPSANEIAADNTTVMNKVTFAPEDEIISTHSSEYSISVYSPQSSVAMSSQANAVQKSPSKKAIAEGDSDIPLEGNHHKDCSIPPCHLNMLTANSET
ncbi:unnamed protein product [Calicophoron daubneyi]|uniref:Uncharacterized protein n=1 Tax=Calicophoron daubneyi TaxID=300641 RepID=A0AAV2TE72_CALDB